MADRMDGRTAGTGRAAEDRDTDPRRATCRGKYASIASAALLALALPLSSGASDTQPLQTLIERLDRLERENRELRKEIDELKATRTAGTKTRVKLGGGPPA